MGVPSPTIVKLIALRNEAMKAIKVDAHELGYTSDAMIEKRLDEMLGEVLKMMDPEGHALAIDYEKMT